MLGWKKSNQFFAQPMSGMDFMKAGQKVKQTNNVPLWDHTREERGGIPKFFVPKYLYKPPYGYPRYTNLPYYRWLSRSPYVYMVVQTILEQAAAVPWDIVIRDEMKHKYEDGEGNILPAKQKQIDDLKKFFERPNSNGESFHDIFFNMIARDYFEVNSGILVKAFNLKGELKELFAVDGSTFTRNPDVHGSYLYRKEIIIPTDIVKTPRDIVNPFKQIYEGQAREDAAYFQFGWVTGGPVPFGKREIVWFENMKRTDDRYGRSPVMILEKTLQTLIWYVDNDLDYLNNNNVPKGIISLKDADPDELRDFRQQWMDNQYKKDEFGNYRRQFHKVPFTNKEPNFIGVEFSSHDMQIIEKTKLYMRLVFACFGVTSTELGFVDKEMGTGSQAGQIVQSKIFRKKAVNPMLRYWEDKINHEILCEFDAEDLMFKFLIFDIDEEKNKFELYKLQTESGIRTVNEVRADEGLEPVDWGDEPPRSWAMNQGSNINFGNYENLNDKEREQENEQQSTNEPQPEEPEQAEKESQNKVRENKSLDYDALYTVLHDEMKDRGLLEAE